MGDSNLSHGRRGRRQPLLTGERAVASSGLMLAAILLLFMAAAAWWNAETYREGVRSSRLNEIRAVGYSLRSSTRALLGLGDLESVQRLMVESGRNYDLAECRVVLLDGQVVAHSDASKITDTVLPETLPEAPLVTNGPVALVGTVSYDHLLDVPNRGRARLHITAATMPSTMNIWRGPSGVSIIGAVALLALLLVYRRMRSRLSALESIREALLGVDVDGGDVSAETLVVPSDAAEAVAWNGLLEKQADLQKKLMDRKVGEALAWSAPRANDLDSACDVMRHGLILVDRDCCVSYANGAAAATLRKTAENLMGTSLTELIPDERVHTALRSVVSGATRTWASVEVEDQSEQTYCVLRYSIRPMRADDTNSAMVVISDITQQRVAEETRNAFVAQVTHELRAPLTNIRLYAETAIDEGEGGTELQRRSLNVINQEARRLERIVGDMLSVAEIEAGKYELRRDDVPFTTVLEELKADYQPYADDKQITLQLDLPPKLPTLSGDRDKIALALHNLVGNAIKYTEKGGSVTIRVDATDETATVEVIDSGIGIDGEEQERIFEKFYRADDGRNADTTGSGLGLTLARDVVRMHGGDITVESKIDHGSTFVLTLPTAKAA